MNGMNNSSMPHNMSAAPPPMPMMMRHRKRLMHMTFFWGNYGLVLFDGWPGRSSLMYGVSIIFVFVLALLVELLARKRVLKLNNNTIADKIALVVSYMLKVGLANLLMLALMSFNGGIFIAIVLGHTLGFWLFGAKAVKKQEASSLPTTNCSC